MLATVDRFIEGKGLTAAANFISKLTDSDGEQAETQHWIGTSLACEYISRAEHDDLLEKCFEIGRQLGTMMAAPDRWCRPRDPVLRPPSSVL